MAPLHVPLFLWILVALLLIVVPPVIAPSYWTEGMEYEEELVVDEDDRSGIFIVFSPHFTHGYPCERPHWIQHVGLRSSKTMVTIVTRRVP